jgi:hypothetical protein
MLGKSRQKTVNSEEHGEGKKRIHKNFAFFTPLRLRNKKVMK